MSSKKKNVAMQKRNRAEETDPKEPYQAQDIEAAIPVVKDTKVTKITKKSKTVRAKTSWIYPKDNIKNKKEEPFVYTNIDENPYLFKREKEILKTWLVEPKEIKEKETKLKVPKFLNKKRDSLASENVKNMNVNDSNVFKYRDYTSQILGLSQYNSNDVDFIDDKVIEICKQKISLKDKKMLLRNYFKVQKLKNDFEKLYANILKKNEEEEKKRQYLAENPEIYLKEDDDEEDQLEEIL